MRRTFARARIGEVGSSRRGLSSAAVAPRRVQYGNNTIVETPPSSWRDLVRDTARDPMVWFLAGTAAVFAGLGNLAEAAVLALALLPIAGMDAYLHRRTRATTEGLAGRLASRARVVRDGRPADIPSTELVPGDLALVGEGDAFPADGIIVRGEGLQVDESALSGEAMPVRKRRAVLPDGAREEITLDSVHWGAAGTRLLTGAAELLVVYTGGETLYGQIVHSAQAGMRERTPLQQAIGALVWVLVVMAGVLCIALAGIRYSQGHGVVDALLSAVTLAVAALPEEFPVVFAFFLGVGVYRLAQRRALVRRAVVVENIGRVTCICTDKTGTLTEGALRLEHVLAADGVDPDFLVRVAATAARPESGDPIDVVLHTGATPLDGARIWTFPFTEDRRREVAIVQEPSGTYAVAVKGAPETVLAMTTLCERERRSWAEKTADLAATGHKVIACAFLRLDVWPGGEPDRGYAISGLLAFEDPIREGVAEAVERAQAAGIRILMVTGDHPATATAIARELAIGSEAPRVIEGSSLKAHLGRTGSAREFDVVARAIPSQKLDLVRALQQSGEIVAVTGDGVNDVPALQGADVGIAMGERGTRTAREVASIVLLDDNFRTIVRAIAEGRQLFENLKLSFAYLLMVHAPLVVTAALIPLAGFPLLYLPAHVVWLELIIHPTALLVFQELPSTDSLEVIQRQRRVRFFGRREWFLVALVGTLVTALVLLGYQHSLGTSHDVPHARSMAMVALIVASAAVTAALTRLRSRSSRVAVGTAILSAVVLLQYAPVARMLHMSPLHAADWLIAAAGSLLAAAPAALIPPRLASSKPGQ